MCQSQNFIILILEYNTFYRILASKAPDMSKPFFEVCLACAPSLSFTPNGAWTHQLAQVAIRKAIQRILGLFHTMPEESGADATVVDDHVSFITLDELEKGRVIDFRPVEQQLDLCPASGISCLSLTSAIMPLSRSLASSGGRLATAIIICVASEP